MLYQKFSAKHGEELQVLAGEFKNDAVDGSKLHNTVDKWLVIAQNQAQFGFGR